MDVYTENIGDFGSRERRMAAELLGARLPDGFENDRIRVAMNSNSGFVFLVNDHHQVAMMNGDTLELFHHLSHEGHEGFLGELLSEASTDWHMDDLEELASLVGCDDPQDHFETELEFVEFLNSHNLAD